MLFYPDVDFFHEIVPLFWTLGSHTLSVRWLITCVINHITDEEKSQDLFVHKKETGEGGQLPHPLGRRGIGWGTESLIRRVGHDFFA